MHWHDSERLKMPFRKPAFLSRRFPAHNEGQPERKEIELSDAAVPERRSFRETVKSGSPSYCEPSQSRVVKPRLTRLAVIAGDEKYNSAAISRP